MALITCQNAAFAYEGHIAVSGLHFEINSGDYIGVVGENGSGKSTLIKGLLRLKQPVSGRVLLGDGLRPNEIGYLPQQTAAQKDFPASVFEVVLSGRLNQRGLRPFYTRADRSDAEEQLRRLDIHALRNHCYRDLSGGQQQRVLLARALCAARKVLLLDEPVAGLDPVATDTFYRLMRRLNQEAGITVMMVSHDIPSAVKYAGHMLHVKKTQVFFGSTEAYLQTEWGLPFAGGVRYA